MFRVFSCVLVVLGLIAMMAWSQDANPGSGSASVPTDGSSTAEPPAPSPLLSEPTTPEEFFSAALLMVDLGRFDLAGLYLQQLTDAEPDRELLLKLREEHGTAAFLRLSQLDETRALALPLLEQLNEVARQQAQDPGFVDQVLARLRGTLTEREQAVSELRNLGSAAVPRILQQIQSSPVEDDRDRLMVALARLGRTIVPALVGGLDAPHEQVQIACLTAIGQLDAEEATPFLWSLAFVPDVPVGTRELAARVLAQLTISNPERTDMLSSATAEAELRQQAQALFLETADPTVQDPGAEDNGMVMVWKWDTANDVLTSEQVPIATARARRAVRLAREALLLSPSRTENQRLYLLTAHAAAVQAGGWDAPASLSDPLLRTSMQTGEDLLLETLHEALQAGRADAAWGVMQPLSQVLTPQGIERRVSGSSPMQAALNYPEPRVQFAAAASILRAEPQRLFAGASRLVDVLRRALTDPGQPQAVIIDPVSERASSVSQFLADEGYQPHTETTGKAGFTSAAELGGVDLIVVHVTSLNWPLTMTLSNLRADARTAFIPVIVYGPEETRQPTARLVSRSQPAVFVTEAPGTLAFWDQARTFVNRRKTPPVSASQRAEFRKIAADWLARLGRSPLARSLDLTAAQRELMAAARDPDLAENAVTALGAIPSPEVQRTLADLTVDDQLAIEVRQQAARQLSLQLNRYGHLLTPEQVAVLTSAANAADVDPALQADLMTLVGQLRPEPGLIEQRLQELIRSSK
jgi:hypothetical protein